MLFFRREGLLERSRLSQETAFLEQQLVRPVNPIAMAQLASSSRTLDHRAQVLLLKEFIKICESLALSFLRSLPSLSA